MKMSESKAREGRGGSSPLASIPSVKQKGIPFLGLGMPTWDENGFGVTRVLRSLSVHAFPKDLFGRHRKSPCTAGEIGTQQFELCPSQTNREKIRILLPLKRNLKTQAAYGPRRREFPDGYAEFWKTLDDGSEWLLLKRIADMSTTCTEDSATSIAGRNATAERLIKYTKHISVSPPVAFQIFALVRTGSFPSDALVDLVRLDPDLTAQLLRLCNSADFRGKGVSSLKEAAVRLGTGVIAAKAMSLTLGRLTAVPRTPYCPDPNAFWRHSVQTALVARFLAPFCDGGLNPETAFTAGLLHDLGKLVINCGAPDELKQIVAVRLEKHLPYADAELEVLGADHAEIGGCILERWNLPEQIVAGVRYHHSPDFDRSGMANLIHVAEACSKITADPESWKEFDRVVRPFVLDHLKISRERVEDCWQAVIEDTRIIEAYLG